MATTPFHGARKQLTQSMRLYARNSQEVEDRMLYADMVILFESDKTFEQIMAEVTTRRDAALVRADEIAAEDAGLPAIQRNMHAYGFFHALYLFLRRYY